MTCQEELLTEYTFMFLNHIHNGSITIEVYNSLYRSSRRVRRSRPCNNSGIQDHSIWGLYNPLVALPSPSSSLPSASNLWKRKEIQGKHTCFTEALAPKQYTSLLLITLVRISYMAISSCTKTWKVRFFIY